MTSSSILDLKLYESLTPWAENFVDSTGDRIFSCEADSNISILDWFVILHSRE